MSLFASARLAYLLAATLLWLTQSASASTTFLLDLRGQGTHEVNAWECFPSSCSYGDPRLQTVHFEWIGLITLVTSDGADGVYTGSDILSLSVDSESSRVPDFGDSWAATAVVAAGNIVALDAYFENSPVKLRLNGMTATYDQPDLHHFGRTRATALVTNVPEPSTWAMLALGLCAVAVAVRRRRTTGCGVACGQPPIVTAVPLTATIIMPLASPSTS